jgi:hypothetical protein
VKLAMNMSDEEVADLDGKALDAMYASARPLRPEWCIPPGNNTQSVSEMPE